MNVRLRKNVTFTSGLVFDDAFLINEYACTIWLLTVTNDHREQNIAYDRMKGWITNVLDGAIIIDSSHHNIANWQATNARIIALPEEPVDQIMGIMLYLKLNAMMENRMVTTSIEISSAQGDGMWYVHTAGENIGENFSIDGWWIDPRPNWSAAAPKQDGKVVNLSRQSEWSDFGLDWSQDGQEKKDSVVFADFSRHDNKK